MMTELTFRKTLTANDVGKTGAHQSGIHIPKSMPELLRFLPELESTEFNPSSWVICRDDYDEIWKFRYIYYNNKFHSINGRRNEYRLTHITKFLKSHAASAGDFFVISKDNTFDEYRIKVVRQEENITSRAVVLAGWHREY